MDHRRHPLLRGVLGWGIVALLLALASAARAEEALVLDNGAILRGTVLRDEGDEVVLRLSGIGSDARVTVERRRIVQRFMTVDPASAQPSAPAMREQPVYTGGTVRTVAALPTLVAPALPPLPDEEPRAAEETFFQRSARRAALALPATPGARGFLVAAALLVVLCLVVLATKMVEVQGATLGRSMALAALFVGLVTVDVAWADPFLRADRASVFVPLQLLAWVGCAAGVLRCGLGRAFHLLAFLLVSASLVVFSAGVVLVSV